MSRASFFAGAKKSVPIMLGYAPLGLAFGVIARQEGLNVFQAALMSLTAFTGSGQYIAVGMLGLGAGVTAILMTTFLVNLRYLLFSAAMAPLVQRFPIRVQAALAFGITDETFALNMAQFPEGRGDPHFMLGVNLFSHLSWVANSALGAAAGTLIPDIDRFGVSFALPAMFIALLVFQIKDRHAFWVALAAGTGSVAMARFTESSINIFIASIAAATIGVILCRRRPKPTS